MSFFNLPTEIRLLIYQELLVLSEPIRFDSYRNRRTTPFSLCYKYQLCPAILRVCRKAHHEALPVLYSKNLFQFPVIYRYSEAESHSANILPFFDHIGERAGMVQRISMELTSFKCSERGKVKLPKVHLNNFNLLAKRANVKTLEFSVGYTGIEHALGRLYGKSASEALRMLKDSLKCIPSLEEIIINIDSQRWDGSDELTKQMKGFGWTTRAKRKAIFISNDGRAEFEHAQDCRVYNAERKKMAGIKREMEEWSQEFDRTRRPAFRKIDPNRD